MTRTTRLESQGERGEGGKSPPLPHFLPAESPTGRDVRFGCLSRARSSPSTVLWLRGAHSRPKRYRGSRCGRDSCGHRKDENGRGVSSVLPVSGANTPRLPPCVGHVRGARDAAKHCRR